MLESGIFPDSLKIAKIITLYKKYIYINFITNYRPISLLPTFSKVLEPVIFNQLYTYHDHSNLLSEQQYGYRMNHSAELAAIMALKLFKSYMPNRKKLLYIMFMNLC